MVRICRALNQAGARYLLIGGFGVIAHGGGRFIRLKDTVRPQDALDRAFLEGVLRSRRAPR